MTTIGLVNVNSTIKPDSAMHRCPLTDDNGVPVEVQEQNGVSEKIGYERGIHSCLMDKSKQIPEREGKADMIFQQLVEMRARG